MDILNGKSVGLWFEPPYPGCRKRIEAPRMVVGHWTGGEADKVSFDDDFKRVYGVLKNRHSKDGLPMPLSVHYVINGAGKVIELANPELTTCSHASSVNDFSIGIEVVNPGTDYERESRKRQTVQGLVHGRKIKQLAFFEPQLDAYEALCEVLASRFGIPKLCPSNGVGGLLTDTIYKSRLSQFKGFVEHLHVSYSKGYEKVDAGGQLCGHLLRNGWELEGASEPSKPVEVDFKKKRK